MRRSSRALAAALGVPLGLAALTASPPARAFCRTSSCGEDGTGTLCTPAQAGDCGVPLFWGSPCVGYSLQEDASAKGISLEVAQGIFKKAFATWMNAPGPPITHPA